MFKKKSAAPAVALLFLLHFVTVASHAASAAAARRDSSAAAAAFIQNPSSPIRPSSSIRFPATAAGRAVVVARGSTSLSHSVEAGREEEEVVCSADDAATPASSSSLLPSLRLDAKPIGGRRSFLASSAASSFLVAAAAASAGATPPSAFAAEPQEAPSSSYESIAARAARISKEVESAEEVAKIQADEDAVRMKASAKKLADDPRTAYDFSLPVAGEPVPFGDLVQQEFAPVASEEEGGGSSSRGAGTKVKAILVVNIKQDDPIARKDIAELIALASKFGRNGEFVVVSCPTDQGYYEPDTSALIRLKLASEYGYGINPATVVTDKVNLLGTGAHPFWRWLEGTCRTPAGLGKIQANFEKFLLDGKTGKPLRRYPRKYDPADMTDDIDALVRGKPLPPPAASFREEWRNAAYESERDQYRFQKGLNVFDQ